MEAAVAAIFSQQRLRFHKLERTRPWWGHTNHDVRVPGVYLTSAFLAFLHFLSERRMNNLRVCNGLDGSIPTAPTKSPVESVVLATRNPRFGA
jgi:hypothetical protein